LVAASAETCVYVSQVGARQVKIQQHASRQLLGWHTGCRSDNDNHLMQPKFKASLCMTLVLCSVRASVSGLGWSEWLAFARRAKAVHIDKCHVTLSILVLIQRHFCMGKTLWHV